MAYTSTDLDNRTAQQGEEKVLDVQGHDVRNGREYPDETEAETKQFPCRVRSTKFLPISEAGKGYFVVVLEIGGGSGEASMMTSAWREFTFGREPRHDDVGENFRW